MACTCSAVKFASPLSREALFGRLPLAVELTPFSGDAELDTAQTIGQMWLLAQEDSTSEAVTAVIRQAQLRSASDVWRWVKDNIRYVSDEHLNAAAGLPADSETLVRPRDLLRMPTPAGDCDDFSMMVASLLLALGLPCQFVTIDANPSQPGVYSHVFVSSGDLALDASHGHYPGWRAAPISKERYWDPPAAARLNGLGLAVDWGSIIETGAQAAAKIGIARYGQPPVGTYQQTGPNGTVLYRQQPNAGPLSFPGIDVGGSNQTLLLALLVGGALLFALSRRG